MGPKLTMWAFVMMMVFGLLAASHSYTWKLGYIHGISETTEILRTK